MTFPFHHPFFQWFFTATACLLGSLLAYWLVGSSMAPSLFWPASGVAVAAVLLWGWGVAPAAALGTALAVLVHEAHPMPALWLGLAVAVQASLARLWLRQMGLAGTFNRVEDLLRLVLFAGLLAGLAAVPLGYLALKDTDDFWSMRPLQQIGGLWISQLDAVLVFTTLMLCWREPDCGGRIGRRLEIGLVLLALALLTLLLSQPASFGLPATGLRPYPLLPLLLWLALRANSRMVALALAWIYAVMAANEQWGQWALVMLSDTHWLRPLNGFITVVGLSFLVMGMLLATNRRLERARLADAVKQRDALVREVHHRIKNNLQTVVGLLRREITKHPEARPMLESSINQVRSIAVVHGLHGRVSQSGVKLCELLPAICRNISEISGVPVTMDGILEGRGDLRILESESTALALILNELINNAVKHRNPDAGPSGVSVTLLMGEGAEGRVLIHNPGILPPGLAFTQDKCLGTGLALVRALMPTRGITIDLRQAQGRVETEVRIGPPILTLPPLNHNRENHEQHIVGGR